MKIKAISAVVFSLFCACGMSSEIKIENPTKQDDVSETQDTTRLTPFFEPDPKFMDAVEELMKTIENQEQQSEEEQE